MNRGIFYGFSQVTVVVILLSSAGGLLVSIVVRYMDNIVKGFATSIAIVLTAIVSYYIFEDLDLNLYFICGTANVLISVANYNE